MLEKFCDYLLIQKNFGWITIGNYRRVLQKFLKENQEFNKEIIEKYVITMHKKGYSRSHIVNTSLALEKYTEFVGTPVKLGRPRKQKSLIKDILTEGEIARILAATKNNREKAMISILAYSGLRNKELCGLKVKDIDIENNVIKVFAGKGNKDGISNITRECIKIITEYIIQYPREEKDYLFTTLVQGKQYNGWALRKMVKVVSQRAKIKKRVYPHLFRHSIATLLLNKGANIVSIQQQLRHSNLQTTMIYVNSSPQRVQQEYQFFVPHFL